MTFNLWLPPLSLSEGGSNEGRCRSTNIEVASPCGEQRSSVAGQDPPLPSTETGGVGKDGSRGRGEEPGRGVWALMLDFDLISEVSYIMRAFDSFIPMMEDQDIRLLEKQQRPEFPSISSIFNCLRRNILLLSELQHVNNLLTSEMLTWFDL